jgi:pimeloyl-ACP methyl ester carboxylesterase
VKGENDMYNEILVEQFCTPTQLDETDFDRRAFKDAKIIDIEFEERILRGYSMGTGRNILLIHGWGSRASHLAVLARYLVNSGFHVTAFDGPAHGHSRRTGQKDRSSMLEFGRAVSCAAKKVGDIYAVIGHSIGATAAAFSMAGTGLLSEYRFGAERLVLISAPESISSVVESFCRDRNEADRQAELLQSLEHAFNFTASDYNLSSELKNINSEILIIHDEQDEEIPVSDALRMNEMSENARLLLTKGSGHRKILMNRDMLHALKEFL